MKLFFPLSLWSASTLLIGWWSRTFDRATPIFILCFELFLVKFCSWATAWRVCLFSSHVIICSICTGSLWVMKTTVFVLSRFPWQVAIAPELWRQIGYRVLDISNLLEVAKWTARVSLLLITWRMRKQKYPLLLAGCQCNQHFGGKPGCHLDAELSLATGLLLLHSTLWCQTYVFDDRWRFTSSCMLEMAMVLFYVAICALITWVEASNS